jgi:hypothetical protein
MKNKYRFALIALFISLLTIGLTYFFWESSNNRIDANKKLDITSKNSINSQKNIFDENSLDKKALNNTTEPLHKKIQILTPQINIFINQIEAVLRSMQSRESKLSSLMNILRNAQSDDEYIATLQSLSMLKPIEYTDELMVIVKSNQKSDKIRTEALKTLSNAYLLDDNEVQRVGASTVYVQMEKVRQHVESVVKDKQTPPKLYQTALQNYAFMNSGDAFFLAKEFMTKPSPLSESESSFVIDTLFVDSQNLIRLLPIIQKNRKKITHKMVAQMAVMAAEPVILERLSHLEKQQIINIVQTHKLDSTHSMFNINSDTIHFLIQKIKGTL